MNTIANKISAAYDKFFKHEKPAKSQAGKETRIVNNTDASLHNYSKATQANFCDGFEKCITSKN